MQKQEVKLPKLTLSPLAQRFSLAGAALIGALAVSPATAAGGSYYRAELAKPTPEARFVARDVVWLCEGAACTAARGTSRPMMMCAALVKKAGPVTGFIANGKALEAGELARCNGEG